tara:strand:+ start:2104 stop:2277 length:174 start_codon:yes stop_codon:yes gene_type:complete
MSKGFISMSSTPGLRRSAIFIALIFLIAGTSSAASELAPNNDENRNAVPQSLTESQF